MRRILLVVLFLLLLCSMNLAAENIKALFLLANNYGANYNLIRDKIEQYGWEITLTAVTDNVESWGSMVLQVNDGYIIVGQKRKYNSNSTDVLLMKISNVIAVEEPVNSTEISEKMFFISSSNTFRYVADISFNLPNDAYVSLNIYDVQGRQISSIVRDELKAGIKNYYWFPKEISAGFLFCKVICKWFK